MSNSGALAEAVDVEDDADISPSYLETLALVERLHRLLLDVIKDEFERLGRLEINAVQALLLFNIADKVVTAGGKEVHRAVSDLFRRHARDLGMNKRLRADGMAAMNADLRALERYWTEEIKYIY